MNISIKSPLLIKVIAVFTLTVTFVISSFANAAGAESQQLDGMGLLLSDMVEDFNTQTAEVGKDDRKTLVKRSKQHLKSESILVSLDFNNLDFSNALIRELENGEYFVKVNIKGKDEVENFNTVGIIFDENKEVTSTFEVNLTQTSEEAAQLKTWSNGELASDVELKKPDVEPQWSWKVFNDCLSSKGIPWATVAALGFLCGAACIGTAGAACVGCLLAAGTISSGTIGWCLGAGLHA